MKQSIRISLLVSVLLCLFPAHTQASTMSNDTYTLEKHSVTIQQYVQEQPKPAAVQTHKPLATGTNYTVDTNKPDGFSFTTSQAQIDLGKLTATNPVLRDLILEVTSHTSYQLLAQEDHPLRTKNNLVIPDTTCDNGSCTEITSAPWLNTLTYGFGYHTDDSNDDAYKQFADSSRNEAIQPLTQGIHDQSTKLTYKVNISGTQTLGAYSNTITIIATPDY